MLALRIEKSWYTQKIHHTRQHLQKLQYEHTGFFVRDEGFSFSKLAGLLQDIARAKLEEIRLMLFIEEAEQKLRASSDGVVVIGEAPVPEPRKADARPTAKRGISPVAIYLALVMARKRAPAPWAPRPA